MIRASAKTNYIELADPLNRSKNTYLEEHDDIRDRQGSI